ncbi:unnamed protein product [Adineta steineri]|uniref:Uncharacterized protein n=1 Tax=Adineta steineri TaxID=433720 RepID=A0A814DZL3_9BILA|nr:unnamed protein product [Adineta steineri]CAF3515079.1 unnamed protein product [Adineta steineri]
MDQSADNINGSTYKGLFIFSSIAASAGLPIDQFNFLLSELLALIFALIFRRFLPPKPSNTMTRHIVASLLGLALGYFCFGAEIWHLIAQSAGVYLMLYVVPPKHSYLVIFVFCMIYMSVIHIHRVIYDYGNYTLDISGPLMINTQKLTALAFAFFDGYRSKQQAKRQGTDKTDEKSVLSPDQETQKINHIPNIIEYFSYIFYFHGICVGPLCFFKDYCNFIEGKNLLVIPVSKDTSSSSDKQQSLEKQEQPSVFWPVFTKLLQCGFWGYILMIYTPYYPVEHNLSQEMVNSPFIKRVVFLLWSTFCSRVKYYFAFILSEAINNAAGLGFNGYDKQGVPQWNLLTNVKPLQLESATSLKVVIDMWNIQTALWLRRVCYDRLKNGRTLGVFVLSALWHGFYPGYYVCFILAAFHTYAGRGIRRQIRPYFQKNEVTKIIYACLTWFGTQMALSFAVTPFVLMEIRKAWYFYQTWYFSVPILSIILALTLNGSSSKSKQSSSSSQEKEKKGK